MKRFALLCGLVAAFLCLAQNADAQYARKGAKLVDPAGTVLSDQAIIKAVGNDIYEQTVIGARKQYKAGRALITGGIIGIGAGVAGAVLTGVKVAKAGYSDVEAAVQKDASIAAMYLGSTAIMSLGATALSGGIVFKTIGKKRLDWVAGQANGVNLTCQFGPTSDGMGLSLRF